MGVSRNGNAEDESCVTDDSRVRVLVVDDDPDVTALVRTYLTRLDGVAVETTSDPEAALGCVEENRHDCVVSDYEMPGANGLDLLESVYERHDNVPFVLFTAECDEFVRQRVQNRGGTIVCKGRNGVQKVADYVANHVGPN